MHVNSSNFVGFGSLIPNFFLCCFMQRSIDLKACSKEKLRQKNLPRSRIPMCVISILSHRSLFVLYFQYPFGIGVCIGFSVGRNIASTKNGYTEVSQSLTQNFSFFDTHTKKKPSIQNERKKTNIFSACSHSVSMLCRSDCVHYMGFVYERCLCACVLVL